MIATRDIAKGEEVVNDYGPLSNAELLRAYGYVERNAGQGSAVAVAVGPTTATVGGPTQGRGGHAKAKSSRGADQEIMPLSQAAAGLLSAGMGETGPLRSLRDRLLHSGIPGNTNSHVQVGM